MSLLSSSMRHVDYVHLVPLHISYGRSFAPSLDQENSTVAIASSFLSRTSSTSSPIPATNMDALALLNAVCKNESVAIVPSSAMTSNTEKGPRIEESTQDTEGSDWPKLTYRRLKRGPATLRALLPLLLSFLLLLPSFLIPLRL
ncbi:hypothetical protein J1N35_037177 [Gossypium stocksii]|uniref:Uncharacterized protein n=1 Tax=Gossypium stocksii TaxID=47602 RepID=A0A9D3UJN4_9ROSI|nr:hypothetical protein J1N35_037177 [Gossypium stocksii]